MHVFPQRHGTLGKEDARKVVSGTRARSTSSSRSARNHVQALIAQLCDGDAAQRAAQRRQRARQRGVGVLDAALGAREKGELSRHGFAAAQAALRAGKRVGLAADAHGMPARERRRA